MRRYVCAVLMIVMLVSAFAGNVPAVSADYPAGARIVGLVHEMWEVNALYLEKKITEEDYLKQTDAVKSDARMMAKQITDLFTTGNRKAMEEFAAFYNSKDIQNHPELKDGINALIADDLVEFLKSRDLTPDTYFPGYGYAEPGFVYRKGEEISSEVLSVFWKKVQKTVESGKTYVMNLEAGANLGANFSLKPVGAPFTMDIGGKLVYVQKCEVTVKETVNIEETVKFQKMKIWFKLYRAKDSFWGSYKWEEVGKTYDMKEEESGLPVVETPGKNTAQVYYPGFGYADPDYDYKKGKVLSSEALSAYWKHVKKTLSTGTKTKIVFEAGAEASFGGGLTLIPTSQPFQLNIGGKIAYVREYEVTASESTTIEETVKFQRTKVTFELSAKPKNGGAWEVCGSTYQIDDEESGLPVVEVAGTSTIKADQTYYPGFGYADPSCEYKLGKEVKSEALAAYWKKVSKTLSTGTKTKIVFQAGAEASFGGGLTLIPTSQPFTLNINGKIAYVREYEVTANETTTIEETVKFQRTKKTFEIFEKPKTGGTWALAGTTYTIIDEESGLPVVEQP